MTELTPFMRFLISKLLAARSFPRKNRTKKGPGRIPFFKTGKPAGSKMWRKREKVG